MNAHDGAAPRLPLSYSEAGASTRGPLPPGYRHLRHRQRVGRGETDLARYADAILRWELHRRAGLKMTVSSPVATVGDDLVIGIRLGPVTIDAPARVVAVVDEEARRGFAYGTLLGHPERGEEAFLAELDPDESVWLHVVGFSRPARWFSAAAPPLTRAVQDLVTRRYMRMRLN